MLVPALVTIPGMIAAVVVPKSLEGNFNLALPVLMQRYYPHGLLGLGFTALLASFMSGMAGNVTAFNTVWTYDIYQTYLVKNRPDKHYLQVGRMVTILGTALSIFAAYIVLQFDNLMDYMQLIGTLFISPFFVIFFLGMFSPRITPTAGFCGMAAGVLGGIAEYTLYRTGLIAYNTPMAATLNLALWGATAGLLTSVGLSFVTTPAPPEKIKGLVYQRGRNLASPSQSWYATPEAFAIGIAALFCFLNFFFR
jgi:SSS family solute:Na+ symporter